MDFLKDAALTQSPEHYQLIIMIAGLSSAVLFPYLAFVVGSSVLSVWYDITGKKKENDVMMTLAHHIFDLVLYNKSIILFLGLLPALSILFVYAQIFQTTESITIGLAGFGLILLIIGFVLLYTYKYTFRVKEILDKFDKIESEEKTITLKKYKLSNAIVYQRSGIYGVLIILAAAFLFVAAYSIAIDRILWKEIQSIFSAFLSINIWLRFLFFISISLGMTGFGTLYLIEGGKEAGFKETNYQKKVLRFAVISLLTFPVLMIFILLSQSISSLSASIFFFTGIAGLLLFIAGHFLYAHYSRKKSYAIRYGFYIFIIAIMVWIANDHLALNNATKEAAALLAVKHEKVVEEMRTNLGIVQITFTGEDIYNAKCSACHLIDQRKVGPAYKDVLPKYANDKAKLIAFVLNPQKVNPDYPPMPAQGLKPAEADSVATYLLSKFSQLLNK